MRSRIVAARGDEKKSCGVNGAPLGRSRRLLRDQKGMALILTLVLLAVMSILGAMAISNSTSELGISSNFRSAQESFYGAERAVEYAMTDWSIYNSIGTGNVPLNPLASNINVAHHGGLKTTDNDGNAINNEVRYLTAGALPPGSGSDPTYFQSRYYVISVTGEGPNNATTRIEAQVARIVPK